VSPTPGQTVRTFRPRTLAAMLIPAGLVTLFVLKGSFAAGVLAMVVVLTHIALAGLIVLSAGGWTWPVVSRIAPPSASRGLRLATSVLLGLWLYGSAMLVVGSFVGGLTGWVWWPVIVVGSVLAGLYAWKPITAWTADRKLDGRALVWVVAAIAGGIALAGLTVPAGFVGGENAYDILEYHLQVPREYYEAGRVTTLEHNCYSFYPLGVEMLFLLGMVLRGGAYEGMYLAKLLHASYGVLAVGTVFLALRRREPARARFAAGLLASVPIVLFLSWQAMVELAMVCHLVAALLWLRLWSRRPTAGTALCAGLMTGGACAVKYLSVGFIAGPLLAMMLAVSGRRGSRLAHVALAGAATAALFAPWLIRNAAATGNPVFPLATELFGAGHWDAESEKRWVDGHSPDRRPPVPLPHAPPTQQPPETNALLDLYNNLLANPEFGCVVILLAGAGLGCLIARSPPQAWEGMLVGTAAIQVAVWLVFTRGSPPRFIVPVTVPVCLLAGGALARLAAVRKNPLAGTDAPAPAAPWGLVPAAGIFLTAVGIGLFSAGAMYNDLKYNRPVPPFDAAELAAARAGMFASGARAAPGRLRVLLVGEARAFYFPPGTVYATAFDAHPLAELIARELGPAEIVRRLRTMGITHVWVDWFEMVRLRSTYGYPSALVGDFVERQATGLAVGTTAFETMRLRVVKHVRVDGSIVEPTSGPVRAAPRDWPRVTVYAVPDD